MRWLEFFAGRNWMVRDGWVLSLMFITRRDLMTKPSDEGRMILCGAHLEMGLNVSRQARTEGHFIARPFVRFWSDANEIAERLAA